ncbi:MAG: 8-oxo-dGTP diphosphatase [Patescibacteria group bacterium]
MENFQYKKLYSLCLVHTETDVLLGMKKRGLGEGLWNGFGGKVEEGESIEDAAKRELLEESGIHALEIEKIGVNVFEFVGDPKLMEVHIFSVKKFTGEPTESEEMRPQWFKKHEIPYHLMWADDKIWLPKLFEGNRFAGAFTFKDKNIIKQSLKILTV